MPKIKIWVDEAGRWPWLWPVVAAALCFNPDSKIDKELLNQINDSKKLTEKKRENIFSKIIEISSGDKPSLFFWVWVVDNFVIDDINIREANKEAMRRALVELLRKINPEEVDSVVIDGRDNYEFAELKKKPIYIVGWDWKVLEIWAASIIAKVEHDRHIDEMCDKYPNLDKFYDLKKNKGYGTKKHMEGIEKHGISAWHRKTFGICRKFVENWKRKTLSNDR